MTLPNDVARCNGEANTRICDRRDTCRRYLERPEGEAWYMHPQIPGPCIYHIPAVAAGGTAA